MLPTAQNAGARDGVAAHPRQFRAEAARKALHLAAVIFPVVYSAGVSRPILLVTLTVVSGVAIVVEIARRRWSGIGTRFDQLFGVMLRASERSTTDRSERSAITGATWLAMSLLGAVALLDRSPAIAAMWCATAGDPAAALVGVWWKGRHRSVSARKSLIGSAACAIVSFAGVGILAGYTWPLAGALAGVAMLAERFNGPVDDNLAIVVGVGAVARIL